MNYEENFLSYQNVKNGIEEAYSRLLNSNNLAQDLTSNTENYECFLINQNINHKLTTYLSTIDKSKLIYNLEHSKKLIADPQYCEKYLEVIKSYLFTLGIDIEKQDENDSFDFEAVEKSSEKLRTVLSSIKLVAQISIETKNLELFDRVFDIYCIAYEAYANKPNKLLQQCFFSLENTVIETPLFVNYKQFCKDRFISGIFVDLEEQINRKQEEIKNKDLVSMNKLIKEELHVKNFGAQDLQASQAQYSQANQNLAQAEEKNSIQINYAEILSQGIDNQIKSLQVNGKLNLSTLVSIESNCIVANNFSEELVNKLLDSNYKQKFLNLINLYFLKVGVNIGNNVGLPIASFVDKDEIRTIISSLKLIAVFASQSDEIFYQQLQQVYNQIYLKFTQVGLLDSDNGLSECFYANEIGDNSDISQYYLSQKPEGIFFEIENEIDQKRFNQLIEANIKKFDEKTLKFYSEPYLDIRLEKSANQEDYQIQIVYDNEAISLEQVAQECGLNPANIKDWQLKELDEGHALSLSHESTAQYLGITKGAELNQTLLVIRDQAHDEHEELVRNSQENEVVSNDSYDENQAQEASQDLNANQIAGEDFSDYEIYKHNDEIVDAQISESVQISMPQDFANKINVTENEFKNTQDGVFDIYQSYLDNFDQIKNAIESPLLQRVLNFSAINPDLKVETTTNPICETVRHQIKLVFRKGFTEQNQAILAGMLTEGECKEWQLSQALESMERGFAGSFIIPHDYSARMLGVRNPNDVNNAIEEVFSLVSNLEIFNMSLIEHLRKDLAFNILQSLVSNDFSIAFDYSDSKNIFSKKNLVLIAPNDEEREYIYNFLGYSWEQNQQISREELLDHRAQITDTNGDIILTKEICASLFGVHRDSDIDLTIRKMESYLQANKQLCDIFNADEHTNLVALLELDNQEASNQDNEDYSDDEDELKEIYV